MKLNYYNVLCEYKSYIQHPEYTFARGSYVPNTAGFAVTLETLSPVNLTNARFLKDNINQLLTYEKAAWLNTQIHLAENQAQIGSVQFAMWELFTTNAAATLTATQQI